MAHPQPAHTHFCKKGGRGERLRNGEVEHITEMGEGTGCLAPSSLLSSLHCSTYMPAYVCICVHMALSHMYVKHVTGRGLHFTLSQIQEAKQRALWEQS